MPRLLVILLLMTLSAPAMSAKLLILGDSLSAGYNMATEKSWPALLNTYWQNDKIDHFAINASISGETTDGGLRRLPALLDSEKPDFILIELGANDGLRGFTPDITERNLKQMISISQTQNIKVILMQIKLPRNYGKRYNEMFEAIYPTLGTQFNVSVIPFLLEPIIVQPDLMMKDGLHPNEQAQPMIARSIQEQLKPLLK